VRCVCFIVLLLARKILERLRPAAPPAPNPHLQKGEGPPPSIAATGGPG
jgi:hypothetical protein